MNNVYMNQQLFSKIYRKELDDIPNQKLLISTINAHAYNLARKQPSFLNILQKSDILLPDGISIVLAMRVLSGEMIKKIAGADLFYYEMKRLNRQKGTCFFLGSSESTLQLIYNHAAKDFPDVSVHTYSPPYKEEFSDDDNLQMLTAINEIKPDVLFVGMTAPKQEKWAYQHINNLSVNHVCCIGAAFDFYAGTVKRAPHWLVSHGLEWFYRLIKEPRRMGKRYLVGNTQFIYSILNQKIKQIFKFA